MTTSDRELLELAAKAAGIDGRRLPDAWPDRFDDDQWNPLIDDGDALRLAVKLNLAIYPQDKISTGIWSTAAHWDKVLVDEFSEKVKDKDPYTATRRAIVRAAAAIGESL